MEILIDILFWIHLISLALAGAAVFGIPVVGSKIGAATVETRPLLFSIVDGLTRLGRAAMALLLITGPLILWLRYGWAAPNAWFWVKMVLVVILLGIVIYAGINGKRAQSGDEAAAMRAPMIGIGGIVAFLCVVAAAVLSFG